jgi:hypothetical protein
MKPRLANRLFGLFLLTGLLFSTLTSSARPPRQHMERGVIQTVDQTARSFTIIAGKNSTAKTFIWNDGTRFRQESSQPDASWISRLFSPGEKTTSETMQSGRKVRFYYRKESGRLVARGVTVLAASVHGCACCQPSLQQ